MGIWDSITETASEAGSAISSVGSSVYDGAAGVVSSGAQAVSDGAGYVAGGAASLGSELYGYGQRAVQGVGDAASWVGNGIADGASAVYHGLTDWHFEGRAARNGPPPPDADLPATPGTPNAQGWQLLPDWMARYHDNGEGAKERKYINSDGRESVRDGDSGAEVTDPRYMATYNYVNPMSWDNAHGVGGVAEFAARGAGHFFADMLPYYIGGNVRGPG